MNNKTLVPIVLGLKMEKTGESSWRCPTFEDAQRVADLLAPHGAKIIPCWILSHNLVFGEMERDQLEKVFDVMVTSKLRVSFLLWIIPIWIQRIWFITPPKPKTPDFLEGLVEEVAVVRYEPISSWLYREVDVEIPKDIFFLNQ